MTPTQLYHQFWRPLLFMATNIVGPEAEDIVADTFVRLIKSKPEFSGIQKAKAWLYITTANSCRDYLKKKERERRRIAKSLLQQEEPNIEQQIIKAELYHEIWQAIQQLPPQCRKIFMMKLEGKDYTEIAAILGISRFTVKQQAGIGYRKIRVAIF